MIYDADPEDHSSGNKNPLKRAPSAKFKNDKSWFDKNHGIPCKLANSVIEMHEFIYSSTAIRTTGAKKSDFR